MATARTASRRSSPVMRGWGTPSMLVIAHNDLGRRVVGVDDEHRHRAVVQHEVAHAAEHRRAYGAAAARAHDDEVVAALLDALEDRLADRLLGPHPRHRNVVRGA